MSEKAHRLAVIDIGSNAIRLQVSHVHPEHLYPRFKRLEYVRFPLRLGKEVFHQYRISEESAEKIIDLMQAYRLLMRLYEVEDYMACATSAMREAENGADIVEKIRQQHDLDIEVISGQRESEVLGKAIEHLTQHGAYLHVDVGGGSTEVNFYENGQKLAGRSFPIGGVRQLHRNRADFDTEAMHNWIHKQSKRLSSEPRAIGTGGNINKLRSLLNKKETVFIPYKDIFKLHTKLARLSYEERMDGYDLNPDRADVIVTAGQIYLSVMETAGVKKVIVPNVGLREGMLRMLLERNRIPVAFPD